MKTVLILALVVTMVAAKGVPFKPGCPNPNQGRQCLLPYRDQCQTDFDCELQGKHLCCLSACGKKCVELHPNPRCPNPVVEGLRCIHYHHSCNVDSECDGGRICCLTAGCGRSCKEG
uniref:Secretory leukocyte proteinase inhibitor n=1 Tax=Penaeus vannamei TaxID=6689 RepID=B2BCZ2_PENVA|nr:secretory leukocyte proteinase inhibitor [Penaeus vannamei]